VEADTPQQRIQPIGAPKLELDRREIGRVIGAAPGPTLVVVAGIHGNEPAGIDAARRVVARLARGDLALRGELVVFAGNVAALRRGVRYQSKDLNRQWGEAQVAAVRALAHAAHGAKDAKDAKDARDAQDTKDAQDMKDAVDPEDREQGELLAAIEAALDRARGQAHLADLHTSSARGVPFILFGDTLPQRRFVRVFPIPVIFGLEEAVDGVLTQYWTQHGCVTFTCEGGQHGDPASVDSLEAVLWLALCEAGLIDGRGQAEVARSVSVLEERRGELPRVLEVVSRRAITAEDAFRMEPGFRNIAPASAGQLLARDRRGEIRAEADGLVILPLYQGLGADGYFWGRAVSSVRLKASEILRRIGVDRLLGLLPGVARDPLHPWRFSVDTRVARIYPLEVFHLLGYRRMRQHGDWLTVERQARQSRS
jgi:predicted deacylase